MRWAPPTVSMQAHLNSLEPSSRSQRYASSRSLYVLIGHSSAELPIAPAEIVPSGSHVRNSTPSSDPPNTVLPQPASATSAMWMNAFCPFTDLMALGRAIVLLFHACDAGVDLVEPRPDELVILGGDGLSAERPSDPTPQPVNLAGASVLDAPHAAFLVSRWSPYGSRFL